MIILHLVHFPLVEQALLSRIQWKAFLQESIKWPSRDRAPEKVGKLAGMSFKLKEQQLER